MATPARLDGDVVRVNWRLAEVLHGYRGLKSWDAVKPVAKRRWYLQALKFRASMLGKELEIIQRYETDDKDRWEPDRGIGYQFKKLPCMHCGREVEATELFKTIPQSKLYDRCVHCAKCLHTTKIKNRGEGLVRCRNCGIIIKVLKYKGRWA